MALAPIETAALFRPLLAELIDLLRSLDAVQWSRPTSAGAWRVRDVAAHLLDGDLRRISVYRDGHLPTVERPPESHAEVARLVNRLNAAGVAFAERLSPALITDLLTITGEWVASQVESLPPYGPAIFAVSWAGESTSDNWMDTGREYTERWHHQMQIRDAVGRRPLLEPRWLTPLLDISVRALPHAYAGQAAAEGACLALVVDNRPEHAWTLSRVEGGWSLRRGAPSHKPDVMVAMSADTAWRLFYNGLRRDELDSRITITGNAALAHPLLRARSIVI